MRYTRHSRVFSLWDFVLALSLLRSFSSCFCLIDFFRTLLFFPWCSLLLLFFPVHCYSVGTGFTGSAAPTSRAPTSQAPWELIVGRRVLSFWLWPCARQLVDGFCSLGEPFLRRGFFPSSSGDSSFLPSASQETFLALCSLAQSPVKVKSMDGIWLLRCFISLARLFC